ncbi:MAG: hypothetical protein K0S47_3464 [Herbinix sp.]|jgi:hypothetical protein|nr:hypothetical protein [Herbinix sp.]
MDDFICRAKRADKSGWVYGWPAKIQEEKVPYYYAMIEQETQYIYKICEETIGRSTGKKDYFKRYIYQHDILRSITDLNKYYEVCFGDHKEWNPKQSEYESTLGFYLRSVEQEGDLRYEMYSPLGSLDHYEFVGSVIENPEFKQLDKIRIRNVIY